MKITTQRDLIKKVSEQYKGEYPQTYPSESNTRIRAGLAKLDADTCTAKDVNDVFGNDSWTIMKCDQCGSEVEALITLGDQSGDYDVASSDLCFNCVEHARIMVQAHINKNTPTPLPVPPPIKYPNMIDIYKDLTVLVRIEVSNRIGDLIVRAAYHHESGKYIASLLNKITGLSLVRTDPVFPDYETAFNAIKGLPQYCDDQKKKGDIKL